MSRRVKERDISEIRAFVTCGRKWYYAYRENAHPVVAPLALAAGAVFHDACELIHSGRPFAPKLAGWVAEKLAELDALPDPDVVSWDADTLIAKCATLSGALDVYAEYHRENPDDLEVVAQEQKFSWRVPGTGTRLIGRIDGIARTAGGQLVVMELKTAGKRYDLGTIAIDMQCATYPLAMHETMSTDFVGTHLRVLYTGSGLRCKINKDGCPSTSPTLVSDAETLAETIELCKSQLMAEREEMVALPDKKVADKVIKKIDTALLKLASDDYIDTAEQLRPTKRSYVLQTQLQTWNQESFGRLLQNTLIPVCKQMDSAIAREFWPQCGSSQFTCNMCQYKDLCVTDALGQDRTPLFDPDSASHRYVIEPERHHYLGGDTSWLDDHNERE